MSSSSKKEDTSKPKRPGSPSTASKFTSTSPTHEEKLAVSGPVLSPASRETIRKLGKTSDLVDGTEGDAGLKDTSLVVEELIAFGDYERIFRDKKVRKDPLPELVTFPKDDISVEYEKRKRRTVKPILPEDLRPDGTPDYIQDCISSFTKDWRTVNLKYRKHTLNAELRDNYEDLPEVEYEVDKEDVEYVVSGSSKDDEYVKPFLDDLRDPDSVRKTKKAELLEKRHNLFLTFPMEIPQDPVDQRLAGKPFKEQFGTQILVTLKQLEFDLGSHEPFFVTLALYDLKKREKISETFHVDLNTDKTLMLLGPHLGTRDAATMAKKAIFGTSYASPDIYLVLVASVCLRGEEDPMLQPYVGAGKLKEKEKDKWISETRQTVLRLGSYRQHFGYLAVQLFDDNLHLKYGSSNSADSNTTIFPGLLKAKTDKDIFSWIEKGAGVIDPKGKPNQKLIPGKVVLNISKIGDSSSSGGGKDHKESKLKNRLNPSLVPVHPFDPAAMNAGSGHGESEIIREMSDLTTRTAESMSRLQPNLQFENNWFFFPEGVNFSRYSASGVSTRNICFDVKLMDDDSDPNRPGLKAIYGTSVESSYCDKARSHVFYHNKRPQFFDEFKIKLPTYLTSKHHLLITFYHMTCAFKKSKQNQPPETIVGQCAIPLFEGNRLRKDDRYQVPVAVRLMPGYLAGDVEGTKWIDNGKEIFSFRTKSMSTIYPQDPYLDNLLKQYQQAPRGTDHEGLVTALHDIGKIEPQAVCEYFPILLNSLFSIMSDGTLLVQSKCFQAVLRVADVVFSSSYREGMLEGYVEYMFENHATAKFLLAQVITDSWLVHILQQNPNAVSSDLTLKYSWFLFAVMYKSMVLMLQDSGTLDSEKRESRFTRDYVSTLHRLISLLAKKTRELTAHYSLGKFLNQNMAFFLRDLFSLMDRGSVFDMVYHYVLELDSADDVVLVQFKFQFLKIICDYEHYVPLNIPVADDLSHVKVVEIKTTFWKNHFLAGLVIDEIGKYINKSQRELRMAAVNTLRDLMWRHDHDPRYQSVQAKQRIAQIYFPYLLLVIDNYSRARENFRDDERRNWLICVLFVLKYADPALLQNWWRRDQTPKRKKAFVEVLVACLNVFEYGGRNELSKRQPIESTSAAGTSVIEDVIIPDGDDDDNSHPTKRPSQYNSPSSATSREGGSTRRKHAEQRKKSLAGAGLISPTNSDRSGSAGLSQSSGSDSGQAGSRRSFALAADRSHHRQTTKDALEAYYKPGRHVGGSVSVRGGAQQDLLSFDVQTTVLSLPAMIRKEQNLGREAALTVMNTILEFINDHRNELVKKENVEPDKFESEKLFEKVFSTVIEVIRLNQPRYVLVNMLEQLHWIVPRFKQPLFRFRNSATGELTYQIFKHCNSKLLQLRSMASGAVLLLIRHNYDEMKNFSRMKLQSTIAISRVFAGEIVIKRGAEQLKESLKLMKAHAQNRFTKEKTKHGSLGNEVKELTVRLEQIIDDNLKMEEYSFDPETKADLYHQISQGYLDSPDLRITELDKLAQMHFREGNFEECGMVRILQAVLVAEYLRLLNRIGTEAMPTNAPTVFPNLNSELKLPKRQELESLEQEICQSRIFTEEGFIVLLKEAVQQLKRQILFETCVEVYRLLLPIYQYRRNYLKQAECYADLHVLCKNSVQEMQSNQRIFANYYRVAFFGGGEKLADLDGQQYIYKENGATRLADFSTRLQQQFGKILPPENIHLVSNLHGFDRSSIKKGHLYMQMVSVEPYFTSEELENKPTLFERHFNITKFIYEVPFTPGQAKISEKLEEQWKRKNIIVAEGAYPFVKKRLTVKETQVIELSPIETAMELIQKKAQSLQTELNKIPRNTKTLQRELQGTLLLQVNAGPAAIAQEFLGSGNVTSTATASPRPSKYDSKLRVQLGEQFIHFLRLLAEGVAVNNQLIGPEQLTLQYELVNGYFRLKKLIFGLTGTPLDAISETFSAEDLAPAVQSPAPSSPVPSASSAASASDTAASGGPDANTAM